MVHKKILSVLVVGTMLCCALPVNAAALSEAEVIDPDPVLDVNPAFGDLVLEHPTMADENGNITLSSDGSLIDFYFPTELNGEAITKITENAFRGCPYFRTVLIDATMEEIGANSFADCEGLEYIVLLDRADAEDMILGENWSGDATVIFELIAVETEAPAEEGTEPPAEPAAPEQSEAPENPESPAEPSEPPVQDEQPSDQQIPGNDEIPEQPDAMKPEEENGEPVPVEPSEPDPDAGEIPENPAAGDEESFGATEDALPPEEESIEPEAPEGEANPETGDDINEDNGQTEPSGEPESPVENEVPESNPETSAEPSEPTVQGGTSTEGEQTSTGEVTESPDSSESTEDAILSEEEDAAEGNEESETDEEPVSEDEFEFAFDQVDIDTIMEYIDEFVLYAKEAMPEYADVIDLIYENLDIEAIRDSGLVEYMAEIDLDAILTEIETVVEDNGGIENCVDSLISFAKEFKPEYADVIDYVYENVNVGKMFSTVLDLLEDETVRTFILSEIDSFIEENGGVESCLQMLVSFAKDALPEYEDVIDQVYESLPAEIIDRAEEFIDSNDFSESADEDFDPLHKIEDELRLALALQ